MGSTITARDFNWAPEAYGKVVRAENEYGIEVHQEELVLLFPEKPKLRGRQVLYILDYMRMKYRGLEDGRSEAEIIAEEAVILHDEGTAAVPQAPRMRRLLYSLSRWFGVNFI